MLLARTPDAERKGKQVQQGRRALDWTQRQLSEKAGVRFTDVAKIESGFPIDATALIKIFSTINDGLNEEPANE